MVSEFATIRELSRGGSKACERFVFGIDDGSGKHAARGYLHLQICEGEQVENEKQRDQRPPANARTLLFRLAMNTAFLTEVSARSQRLSARGPLRVAAK